MEDTSFFFEFHEKINLVFFRYKNFKIMKITPHKKDSLQKMGSTMSCL